MSIDKNMVLNIAVAIIAAQLFMTVLFRIEAVIVQPRGKGQQQ